MSPKTVPEGRRVPGGPVTGAELALGLMTGAVGYVMADLVDRFLEHRQPIIDRQRWTFDEDALFPNVAAMERAFGLLNTAPLSPEQASTFRRTS
jgi:hypothetical protein